MSIWTFDCDGVICSTQGTDYTNSKPDYEIIEKINKLYDSENEIWIFTGRGSVSGMDWKAVTEFQLKEWGVKYHKLIMGKPPFDFFVDDKTWNVRDFRESRI